MKYTIKGKGQVTLDKNSYVTEGGEGQIYIKNGIVYKIYLEPTKMIPELKIKELSVLSKSNIIKPEDIVVDAYGQNVGFTMKQVKSSVALCKLFTTSFRDANKITPKKTQKLIDNMIESIDYVHKKKCLVVDGNEMNYLVDEKTYTIPYLIDVDSYQTISFPATAIMPSIRDWHVKKWNELSDWFSFAVLACQLYVGIHPYKGTHPDYSKKDMELRMKKNISIFNKQVSIPKTTRDFSNIPSEFYKWFVKIFEKGERIPPPQIAGALNVVQVVAKVVNATGSFIIDFIREYPDDIIGYLSYGNSNVVWIKDKVYIDRVDYSCASNTDIVFTNSREPIAINLTDGKVEMKYLKSGAVIPFAMQATDKMVVDNTLYLRLEDKFSQIVMNEIGDRLIPSVKNSWNIMPNSSKIFPGVVYQDVLGKAYVLIPNPKNGSCCNKAIPELNGYRVIDGKCIKNVSVFTLFNKNKYHRCILRIDENCSQYDCRFIDDIDYSPINFTVLDNGICVMMNEDNEVQLFSSKTGNSDVKIINDKDVGMDMMLGKNGQTVMFYKKNNLSSMKMKK